MKALLRYWDKQHYIWKDVTYKDQQFYVDGVEIANTNIVALDEDTRAEFVQCSICGATFKKGTAEWEEHIKPITDTSKCFDCHHLRRASAVKKSTKYTLQTDGTYLEEVQSKVTLQCAVAYKNWNYKDIADQECRNKCVYNKCTTANAIEVSDIFTEKPGIFDDIITVDNIIEAGYRERNKYGDDTEYLLKGKNLIYAIVNPLNIIDRFVVRYRNASYTIYYSSKYNEFYESKYYYTKGKPLYKYEVWHPIITPATVEYIKKKIAALYK